MPKCKDLAEVQFPSAKDATTANDSSGEFGKRYFKRCKEAKDISFIIRD